MNVPKDLAIEPLDHSSGPRAGTLHGATISTCPLPRQLQRIKPVSETGSVQQLFCLKHWGPRSRSGISFQNLARGCEHASSADLGSCCPNRSVCMTARADAEAVAMHSISTGLSKTGTP